MMMMIEDVTKRDGGRWIEELGRDGVEGWGDVD